MKALSSVLLVSAVVLCVFASSAYADSRDQTDSRMVKIEKMRSRMSLLSYSQDPLLMAAAQLHPAVKIDALKQRARENVATKLTSIFDESRRLNSARNKAKMASVS